MTYNLPINSTITECAVTFNLACLLHNQNHLYSIYRLPVYILDMLGGWFSLNHLRQTRDNWLDKPNLCFASRQYRFICALISPELVSYFVMKLSSPKYFNPWISFSGEGTQLWGWVWQLRRQEVHAVYPTGRGGGVLGELWERWWVRGWEGGRGERVGGVIAATV